MPPASRIPSLLQPYIQPPPRDSLVLLTSVLGASTNWLVVKFLCGALAEKRSTGRSKADPDTEGDVSTGERYAVDQDEKNDTAVVLVSWMRDWEFWKTEGRRTGVSRSFGAASLACSRDYYQSKSACSEIDAKFVSSKGLDLARLAQQGHFAFVDGLSGLFLPTAGADVEPREPTGSVSSPTLSQSTQQPSRPVRLGPAVTQRGSSTLRGQPPAATSTTASPVKDSLQTTTNVYHIKSADLQHLVQVVSRAIDSVSRVSPKTDAPNAVLLVLDQPDLPLATNASSVSNHPAGLHKSDLDSISSESLNATILALRSKVHSTIVTLAADTPLSAVTSVSSPLERNHASFLIGAAHESRLVMSLRLLDTGFAGDVSGVLRITKGDEGYGTGEDVRDSGSTDEVDEKEVLYHIAADGNVRVFERGSGN